MTGLAEDLEDAGVVAGRAVNLQPRNCNNAWNIGAIAAERAGRRAPPPLKGLKLGSIATARGGQGGGGSLAAASNGKATARLDLGSGG